MKLHTDAAQLQRQIDTLQGRFMWAAANLDPTKQQQALQYYICLVAENPDSAKLFLKDLNTENN